MAGQEKPVDKGKAIMAGLFQISDFRGLRFLVLGLRLLAFGFDPRPKTQDQSPNSNLKSAI